MHARLVAHGVVSEFRSELSSQLEIWNLKDSGFDYDIVSVFGSQSTGKSALPKCKT